MATSTKLMQSMMHSADDLEFQRRRGNISDEEYQHRMARLQREYERMSNPASFGYDPFGQQFLREEDLIGRSNKAPVNKAPVNKAAPTNRRKLLLLLGV